RPSAARLGLLAYLSRIARRDERLLAGWLAALDPPAPLELGVELGAEENDCVGDPQPDEEHDHASQRTVSLVVRAEVGDIERERSRSDDPAQHAENTAGGDPAKARLLDVRG